MQFMFFLILFFSWWLLLLLGAVESKCILICESLLWNMSCFNKIQLHWIVLGPMVKEERREPRPCDQRTSLYLLQYEGLSKYDYTRGDCSRYVQHMLYQTARLEWQYDVKLVSLICVVVDCEISVSLILKHIIGHDPEPVSFSPTLTICFHKIHLNVILKFPVWWYKDVHSAWSLPYYSGMKCLMSENIEQIFTKFRCCAWN